MTIQEYVTAHEQQRLHERVIFNGLCASAGIEPTEEQRHGVRWSTDS